MTIEQQHQQIIQGFYIAFQQLDAEKMVAYYCDDIQFEDPAFGQLHGEQARNMWRMLIERGHGSLKINFYNVQGTTTGGNATWEGNYLFGKNKRSIHNVIQAEFVINDGKIVEHTDQFNFWKWATMALGTPGKLLGFTPFVQNKVRKNARAALEKYTAT
ncbi:nuclear transport factor 2 family protein [Tunicatimonas pelagia]|uniref:nuclear transport factor 2 family protein n=1 Tax=Tunicatimonas pelagia TaxID=931531 RepID=UPI002664FC7A|nr:nuclear transport factor 2 family protein [Tunicatimonas pelagia]WKN42404.1 nuclear transport factor 2 family protein [Tunicatimonas pelagia]